MTTQTQPTPATKAQLDGLIRLVLEAGYNEEAGLLQLASDSISEKVRNAEEKCCCYEVMGDNKDCPKHGDIHRPFSDDEIKADYQERSDLYNMGMGA